MNGYCINIHLLPNCKFRLIPNASLKYTSSINQSSFIASAFVVAELYILLKYAIGIHSGSIQHKYKLKYLVKYSKRYIDLQYKVVLIQQMLYNSTAENILASYCYTLYSPISHCYFSGIYVYLTFQVLLTVLMPKRSLILMLSCAKHPKIPPDTPVPRSSSADLGSKSQQKDSYSIQVFPQLSFRVYYLTKEGETMTLLIILYRS